MAAPCNFRNSIAHPRCRSHKGGLRGAAIIPGKAAESRLYRVIAGLEKPAMPLDGKLDSGQVSLIKDWIDQGAPWDADSTNTKAPRPDATALAALEEMPIPPDASKYWVFRKPVRVPIPQLQSRFTNPIDLFLEKSRADRGLAAAPRADGNTLMRRAYMDLIGLPPTPAKPPRF